jgi:leucyl aminopeptidase (aminopeptidase T)
VSSEEGLASELAGVMLRQQLRVKRGENVIIETWNHTFGYAAACVVEARRIGARPLLYVEDETSYFRSIQAAPAVSSWSGPGAHEWAALAHADAYVFFPGPADRARLDALPPTVRRALVAYNDEWYRRATRAKLRGVRSVLGYVSESEAERYGVSGTTWRSRVIEASVRADFPTILKDARRVETLLKKGKTVRVTAPNGTDFEARLKGRSPWVDDGVVGPEDLRAERNLAWSPPGYVTVAIDERSAEGMAIANRPSFLFAGRADGGQWEMHAGHLTNFWYTEGQAAFEGGYGRASRGRDTISFLSIGLNAALAPETPRVEDQEGGAVTLGVGGNQLYGGTNRCPFVSYIVMGEATVAVDGQPLVDRGKLL